MIRIIQWLCPQRHACLAGAYDPERQTAESALDQLKEFTAKSGVEAKCFLCGSRDLHYEDMPTKYATMAEAMPQLKAAEQAQLVARRIMGASRN